MVQLREARSQDGWVHVGKVQRELSRHQELLKKNVEKEHCPKQMVIVVLFQFNLSNLSWSCQNLDFGPSKMVSIQIYLHPILSCPNLRCPIVVISVVVALKRVVLHQTVREIQRWPLSQSWDQR